MRRRTRQLCARGLVTLLVAWSFAVLHGDAPPQSQTMVMSGTQAAPVIPRTGSSLLAGKIVDDANHPVGGVVVSLGGGLTVVGLNTVVQGATQAGQRRVLTGNDGRFAFFDLPAGSYSIDATKPGYLAGAYGRLRSGGIAQSVDVGEGAHLGDLTIQVWKYAALTGSIVDEAGEPAVGVQVSALRRVIDSGRMRLSNAAGNSSATTDDRGVFRMASLLPGEYVVCVPSSVSTFPVELADDYQQARQGGSTADWSRIMGAAGVSSSVSQPGFRVGDQSVQTASSFFARSAQAPAPSEDGRMGVYPTIYYPGSFSAAQAQTFRLQPGEERSGVTLQLKLVPGTSVAGTVTGPDGPAARVGVRLVSSYASDLTNETSFDTATTASDAGGHFQFLGVPPGQYTIRVLKIPPAPPRPSGLPPGMTIVQTPNGAAIMSAAAPGPAAFTPYTPPIPPGPTLWANQPIAVGEEGLSGVAVTLNRGVRVTGRFEFDGASPHPAPDLVQSLDIEIQPADGRSTGNTTPQQASTDASGRITTYELPPGSYMVRYYASLESRQALGTWLFRNATIGGRDVSSLPFDLQSDVNDLVVVMTDHPTELSGTVRDAQGRVDPRAAILIVTVDRNGWSNYGTTPILIRTVRPTKDGTYRLVNFIPGEYYAVAIPEAQAGEWQDPAVLEEITRAAARFSIGAGEKKTVDITTRPIR